MQEQRPKLKKLTKDEALGLRDEILAETGVITLNQLLQLAEAKKRLKLHEELRILDCIDDFRGCDYNL